MTNFVAIELGIPLIHSPSYVTPDEWTMVPCPLNRSLFHWPWQNMHWSSKTGWCQNLQLKTKHTPPKNAIFFRMFSSPHRLCRRWPGIPRVLAACLSPSLRCSDHRYFWHENMQFKIKSRTIKHKNYRGSYRNRTFTLISNKVPERYIKLVQAISNISNVQKKRERRICHLQCSFGPRRDICNIWRNAKKKFPAPLQGAHRHFKREMENSEKHTLLQLYLKVWDPSPWRLLSWKSPW